MIKNIFILWFQGFDNAPQIVKKCVESWKFYNPDWNIVLLDDNNLHKYVKLERYIINIKNKHIEKAHLSDIIRVILLNNYGGVWADSTTFCNKPLNDWLPKCIKNGFFAFSKPAHDRLISNWFLYSDKSNYIINLWRILTINYYRAHDKAHTYFIHHYLFNYLYNKNKIFREIWNRTPKLSANGLGPHYLQEKKLLNNFTYKVKNDIDSKVTPLYKLTYRYDFLKKYNNQALLHHLFSTII